MESCSAIEMISRLEGKDCPLCGDELVLDQKLCPRCGGLGYYDVQGCPEGSKASEPCSKCNQTGILVKGVCCSDPDCTIEFPDCVLPDWIPIDQIPDDDGVDSVVAFCTF